VSEEVLVEWLVSTGDGNKTAFDDGSSDDSSRVI